MPFSFSFSSESLGSALPVWSVIPFLGLLVSMAVMPLAAPKCWHDHFGKVSALWGFLAFAPLVVLYGGQALGSFLDFQPAAAYVSCSGGIAFGLLPARQAYL